MNFFKERLNQFRQTHYQRNQALYEELKNGQNPKTLIITCSDSRIVLDAVFQTNPGDIFVIRNAGNIIPPYPNEGGEAATLEYAMNVLNIEHIIILGHANCGAMKGLLDPESTSSMPSVTDWLKHAPARYELIEGLEKGEQDNPLPQAIQKNVMLQLKNLQTYPAIRDKLANQTLQLHGWIYEFTKGQVLALDEKTQSFNPLIDETPHTQQQSHSFFTLNTLFKLSLSALIASALVCLYLLNPVLGFSASLLTLGIGAIQQSSTSHVEGIQFSG